MEWAKDVNDQEVERLQSAKTNYSCNSIVVNS